MGMFDDLRCEVALPDGYEGAFQTKSLDCEMDQLIIRSDGTLVRENAHVELLPENEWAYPDPSHPMHTFGRYRRVHDQWETIDFHGILNFYGGEGRYGAPGYSWHEYDAKFTDGRLSSIKQVE